MISSGKDTRWEHSLIGFKKAIFFSLFIASLAINIADLATIKFDPQHPVFYINLVYSVAAIIIILLYFLGIAGLIFSHGIVIYTLIANILISLSLSVDNPDFANYILRETIFIGILLPTAGFVLRNLHMLILGAFYFVFFLVGLFISKDEFLVDNAIVLIFAMFVYLGWIYYIMHLLKRGYSKQMDLIQQLHKQNQQLDEKKNMLNSLIETKDKFFSIIAHDLKNPFNTLLGFSSLLKEQLKSRDYIKAENFSDQIYQASRQGFNLLNNLLDWSRSQTGVMEYSPEQFNLEAMIDEISLLYAPVADQKFLHMRIEIQSGLIIFADRNMLNTVLRNLISNAIKYSYKQGEITIKVKVKKDETEVSVSDTGTGIKKDRMDELFRLDSSYTETGTDGERGTGLGLVLCKDFIDQHKGRIWVDTNPGKGSTFNFSIPNT